MNEKKISNLPSSYCNAVAKQQQGFIEEISYPVRNFIDSNRRFVTNQFITEKEAGREIISGEEITKRCCVYLPAGYNKEDSDTKYDVLYLLHGVGGNRYEWLSGKTDGHYDICNIFDNLILKGDINPIIIVFPDGRSSHDWTDNSFNAEGTNMLGFYYFDYELRYDLIPFIESNYHTYANINNTTTKGVAYNRFHRALAGLSMGGMQALNLSLGGFRYDSALLTGTNSIWGNGLSATVLAPGMIDLFTYIGAFSNAPTSSEGKYLGTGIKASNYPLNLLYITCGDMDEIAYQAGYVTATNKLLEYSQNNLLEFYTSIVKNGVHDFKVWNHGAYNFAKMIF